MIIIKEIYDLLKFVYGDNPDSLVDNMDYYRDPYYKNLVNIKRNEIRVIMGLYMGIGIGYILFVNGKILKK